MRRGFRRSAEILPARLSPRQQSEIFQAAAPDPVKKQKNTPDTKQKSARFAQKIPQKREKKTLNPKKKLRKEIPKPHETSSQAP